MKGDKTYAYWVFEYYAAPSTGKGLVRERLFMTGAEARGKADEIARRERDHVNLYRKAGTMGVEYKWRPETD